MRPTRERHRHGAECSDAGRSARQEYLMKLFIALLATAGLGGCVAYPYDTSGGYYGGAPYYEGSVYYGSSVPYVVQQPGYVVRDRGGQRGGRDRDRDGVPNRYDRDRDGDGVPNWRDARPNNPRRY
jgi:hypothetical protein